jgi:acetyl-CoA carboxylase biotin carboxyl carrier protein
LPSGSASDVTLQPEKEQLPKGGKSMTKDASNDQALIEAIAKLLNEQNLAEIEIEREDLRVRVTRSYASAGVQQVMVPAAPAHAAAPTPAIPAGAAAGATVPVDDLASNPGTLTSPMVGTAYLSPEPGKPAFVAVGTKVSEGQTILIIEAMKTMNQIPAHKSGTISRILITDAAPVEYGQPLAVID